MVAVNGDNGAVWHANGHLQLGINKAVVDANLVGTVGGGKPYLMVFYLQDNRHTPQGLKVNGLVLSGGEVDGFYFDAVNYNAGDGVAGRSLLYHIKNKGDGQRQN